MAGGCCGGGSSRSRAAVIDGSVPSNAGPQYVVDRPDDPPPLWEQTVGVGVDVDGNLLVWSMYEAKVLALRFGTAWHRL